MKRFREIAREHKRLSSHLGTLLRILTERQRASVEIAVEFEKLKDELVHHFHEEDDGGFFEGIVDHAPRLSERIAALREEHVQLLEQLNELQAKADVPSASLEWWEDMEHSFHEFSCELMRHEHRENEILQEAYGVDIGAQD